MNPQTQHTKTLYIVRHCQAEGQAADAPLTAAGLQQADQLAEFLLDRDIQHILSSPYERATKSIEPLARKLGVDVRLEDRLTERVLSNPNHPEWRERLRRTYDDLDLCYEGGESSRTAMTRAIAVVDEALNSAYDNILIVSHGNLISLLLKYYDPHIGFREWAALSNPDVYQLSFHQESPAIQRLWTG
ncbi:histidine phosphatase family protein [Paenibacillus mendelii]|uniref:Histidine phosphatase family protein n=1 Tax=Paenibacillus mendelii TaxID=206163 RepID=A0ABV6J2Q2_9BACL|nr:histidine phosphatase family protein [Paenibacillus mendelii]MCQ6559264.1 histidine phosphatase family protein [Paenibacillus mendelii]